MEIDHNRCAGSSFHFDHPSDLILEFWFYPTLLTIQRLDFPAIPAIPTSLWVNALAYWPEQAYSPLPDSTHLYCRLHETGLLQDI
ncbi:hypothetical protein D3C78_1478780 [compost metagenome]